jgi:hypothetical protein
VRSDAERRDTANQWAAKRSWRMTRGFIGGALLVVVGLGFTLLVAAFLQYLTIARNNQAGARQPWSLAPPEVKTQALKDR